MKDLFETPSKLPKKVQSILGRYNDLDIRIGLTYTDLIEMGKELAIYGYEFDFYLDCVPYNLKKIKIISLNKALKEINNNKQLN